MLDVFVDELDSGYRFQFPMGPDEIEVSTATSFLTFDIMNAGAHQIPVGEELGRFRWSGLLPGAGRMGAPYIRAWVDPIRAQERFSFWRVKGKRLLLSVPGTPINHAVYLVGYQCTYAGGAGDIAYSIEFSTSKEVIVEIEGAAASQSGAGAGVTTTRPTAEPAAKTYTVKSGDSLWKIAQKQLGSGGRWREIYTLNQGTIGGDPNKIRPGQVFNLPA